MHRHHPHHHDHAHSSCEHHDHHHQRHGHPCVRAEHPFGGGGRRERLFGSGDLKFVVLHLVAQKPAHGYEIIKALGELVGGDYSPSPGTVYPTLAMLEDLGWIAATPDANGRKEYVISDEGRQQLTAQQGEVERVLTHVGHLKSRAHARRLPEIVRAMENLKTALRIRFGDEAPAQEIARRVAEIIDRAAVDIERLQ
ncbi:MAG: PadR family transcriptional regulator [Propionivibrio sp.]